MLSRDDIKQAIIEGHIKIYPFNPANLTGIGYNLTTTEFAFSINQGILLTIHERIEKRGKKHYVIIPPNDTILFFSKEYIEIDNTLSGTFHSKVARVSEGLGHLCTTLDPTWKGQLLLSINNPTSKPITFDFDNNGNIMTVLFHKLITPVTGPNIHDNNKGRCELLLAHFAEPLSNKSYQQKHLELREFVERELADSLNGYDDFLSQKTPYDEFTKKAKILTQLLTRLESDQKKISECNYPLGENGKYSFFKNKHEEAALKSCTIFSLMKEQNLSPKSTPTEKQPKEVHECSSDEEHQESIPIEDQLKALPEEAMDEAVSTIESCKAIIQYELDMINHARRIEWHNAKVLEFAGEKSELVKVREKKEKHHRLLHYGVPIFIGVMLLAAIILLYVFKVFSFDTGIGKIAVPTFSAILGTFITLCVTWWQKSKT